MASTASGRTMCSLASLAWVSASASSRCPIEAAMAISASRMREALIAGQRDVLRELGEVVDVELLSEPPQGVPDLLAVKLGAPHGVAQQDKRPAVADAQGVVQRLLDRGAAGQVDGDQVEQRAGGIPQAGAAGGGGGAQAPVAHQPAEHRQ